MADTTETRQKQAENVIRYARLKLAEGDSSIFGRNVSAEMKMYAFAALDFKLICEPSVISMGVNGLKLYYNPDWILGLEGEALNEKLKDLTDPEKIEKTKLWWSKKDLGTMILILVHEIQHIIHEHLLRKGTRNSKLWNIAADHRINNDIATSWFRDTEALIKKYPVFGTCCMDPKYSDKKWISDLIYEDLLKESDVQYFMLDSHMYGETEEDVYEAEMAAEKVKKSLLEGAKNQGLGEGCGILDLIKADKPRINWKKFLRTQLSGLSKRDTDHKCLSRRITSLTMYLHQTGELSRDTYLYAPGKKPTPSVDVITLFDTSGSISDNERKIMLSETIGIMKQYSDYSVTVGCWGTNFIEKSVDVFKPNNGKKINEYKFYNGGGTDINCCLEFIKSQGIKPTTKIIVFTDCYFGGMHSDFKKYSNNLVFVSTCKNMEHTVKYGRYVEYDKYLN
jgi:predicted metal-dependent peptidase